MPVRPPSLRSIAAFEAAARYGSFSKAADELNLTPGAVSHAIKALEVRLGCRLFDRSGRSVQLTVEGQRLAARVRLSLALLSDAFDTAPWRTRDRLVIATLSSIAGNILLPSFRDLQAACPGVTLDFRCSTALVDLERDADVAIRFGPGGWGGLQSRLLADESLFPVARPDYRAGRLPTSPEDLRECTLIHHPESSWRLWLDPAAADPTLQAEALYIDDAGLAVEAARAGLGIALARGRLVDADLRAGSLVRLFDRSAQAEYGYWAVWTASSPKQPLIAAFTEAVAQLFSRPYP